MRFVVENKNCVCLDNENLLAVWPETRWKNQQEVWKQTSIFGGFQYWKKNPGEIYQKMFPKGTWHVFERLDYKRNRENGELVLSITGHIDTSRMVKTLQKCRSYYEWNWLHQNSKLVIVDPKRKSNWIDFEFYFQVETWSGLASNRLVRAEGILYTP